MKKNVSIALFIISLVVLLLDVGFCVYGIWDMQKQAELLASDPSASGIDYLGLGWFYGVGVTAASLLGAITSVISAAVSEHTILKRISYIVLAGFAVFLLTGLIIFWK